MDLPDTIKRYQLGKTLGRGGFGTVVCATHAHHPDREFALKIERTVDRDGKVNRHPQLYYEYRMYRHLRQRRFHHCFPSVYEFLREGDLNVLVMQRVGPSVAKIFRSHGKSFSPEHIVSVGVQMVACLQAIHECGVVHRDIKPENFCVGPGDQADRLYVLDLGLSKCFRDKDGAHIPHRTSKSLTGTPRYASVRCHEGHEQSRRDDIESAAYVLLYFALGRLPWQGLRRPNRRRRRRRTDDDPILRAKRDFDAAKHDGLHPNFGRILAYARGLEFDETPDYSFLNRLLAGASSPSP